jgi:hypothetical protein
MRDYRYEHVHLVGCQDQKRRPASVQLSLGNGGARAVWAAVP